MSAEQLASHDYSYAGCDDLRRGPADGLSSCHWVPTGKTKPNQRLRHDPTSDVVI